MILSRQSTLGCVCVCVESANILGCDQLNLRHTILPERHHTVISFNQKYVNFILV